MDRWVNLGIKLEGISMGENEHFEVKMRYAVVER